MKSVEYICPAIILLIVFLLKLSVDDKVSFEKLKRLIVETSVDVMALATSFIISFIIASVNIEQTFDTESIVWKSLSKGIIVLVCYILGLVTTVLLSKFTIRRYSETEKTRYIILGIIVGYIVSIFCLCYSITLLRNLGGV